MGAGGFLLLHWRSAVAAARDDMNAVFSEFSRVDAASDLEMPCPHSGAGSHCHAKIALYATGLVLAGGAIGFLVGRKLAARAARCNTHVKMDCDKVVDSFNVEDLGEKKAFCRCWKSKKFPYCDGSHGKHNQETGDNVGPLVISNKPQ